MSETQTVTVFLTICGFCGLNARTSPAKWFIANGDRLAICSDCVAVCNEIIAEKQAETGNQSSTPEIGSVPSAAQEITLTNLADGQP